MNIDSDTYKANILIKKLEKENNGDYYQLIDEIISLDYDNAKSVLDKLLSKDPTCYLFLPDNFQTNLNLAITSIRKCPSMANYIPKYKKANKEFMSKLFKYATNTSVLLNMDDKIFADKKTVEELKQYTKEYTDILRQQNCDIFLDWEQNHSLEYAFPGFKKDHEIIKKECIDIINRRSKCMINQK